MAELIVEITGEARDQLAQELKDHLTAKQGKAQVFAETERGVDLVTIVSVVLSSLQAADIIWQWWQSRRHSGSNVTIRTAGGRIIELSDVDQKQLESVLAEDE
jgi:hypothetical protein